MFCKKCGYQIADDSVFCVNCGTAVDSRPQQPQPQYQQPQYTPQPEYQYCEAPLPEGFEEYINKAGSLLPRSVTALVLTFVIPVYGLIIGFFMSLAVKSGIKKLPDIGEEELVTKQSRDDFASARRKIRSAKKLSSIAFTVSSIFLSILALAGVVLLFVMVIMPNL